MRALIPLVLLATACPTPTDPDGDGDGFASDVDCDDSNAAVNPAADEVCGNGIDDNCDGDADTTGVGERLFWADDDGDGFGDSETSRTQCSAPDGFVSNDEDCDDGDNGINPSAADDQCDDVDDDCDGTPDQDAAQITVFADRDFDGYGDASASSEDCRVREGFSLDATDCDDTAGTTYPGAPELCNGIDDSCGDGVDEGLDGTGEACPGTSCLGLIDLHGATNGDYWLTDGADGAYLARCDMTTDGGGWTRITGQILMDAELYTVPPARGPAGAVIAEWFGTGDLQLRPVKSGGDTCDTVVVQMVAQLPFTFEAWSGSYTATYVGNDTVATAWGREFDVSDTVPEPCDGSTKFGSTFNADIKRGGEWGVAHSGDETVTWGRTALSFATDEFTWEINGTHPGAPPANLEVKDIEIWVR